ncbi:MAG: AraC family transcriptional regulator [Eubacterium sp.]|nr:AraC family transcriptional regulator [Eubacterium sp.]
MRKFDENLLEILKTETEIEKKLKVSEEARQEFIVQMKEASTHTKREKYERFRDKIAVGRMMRYIPWAPHKNDMIQTSYVVSGTLKMMIGNEKITVCPGEFIIPGQDTMVSSEALGYDDIVINFLMRPEFLEEMLVNMNAENAMADFLMSSFRKNARWNSYLLFKDLNDLAVFNLAEAVIYDAFPYLNDDIIMDGVSPDPRVMASVITAMYLALARNMQNIETDKATSPKKELAEIVENYIQDHYSDASLGTLAASLNQSESALSKQIKKTFGMTFKELLIERRFEQAEKLLRNARLSVYEVAVSVGYENTSFFYRKFKEQYGISPNAFRRKYGLK